MLMFLSVILAWAICLVVALVLLPAPLFAFLSGVLLLLLPSPRAGLDYGLLHRAMASLIIVGTGLALSSVLSAGLSSEAAIRAVFGNSCGILSDVLAHLSLLRPSPACRLVQRGFAADAGFGLFLQIGLLANLAWIRLRNYRLRPSRSERASGVNESSAFFLFSNLLLSVFAYVVDKLASLPVQWPLMTFGYGIIALILLSPVVFFYVTAQGNLFPQSERLGKFG